MILVAYEWSRIGREIAGAGEILVAAHRRREVPSPPPHRTKLDGLVAHFEKLLEPRGYFLPAARAGSTRRTLRSLLTKPGWNHLEVRTLRGILSTLERGTRD